MKVMKLLFIDFDTCAGYCIITKAALRKHWERSLVPPAASPKLGDENDSPLGIYACISLHVRIGNADYRIDFFFVEKFVGD